MLHVLNGDATRVAEAGLPGEIVVWADVLHDGPTPGGLTRAEFREARAAHIGSGAELSKETFLTGLAAPDAALDAYADHDELIFWLEHDLFDQLLLLRHLHWLKSILPTATRFSLICVDRFPGVPDFVGLGQLTPRQLASLFPTRQPIGPPQVALGADGWDSFCAPEPMPLVAWLRSGTSELPFAAGALERHLQDYPDGNGLSRTQRQMLLAISRGAATVSALFRACQQMEERIYMGDLTFLSILRELAQGSQPLVSLEGNTRDKAMRHVSASVTSAGQAVLAGEADHIALNGIDRWMGGVHLTTERYWRYSDLLILHRDSGAG